MTSRSSSSTARSKLENAHQALERHAPRFVSRMLHWMRHPRRRKLRVGVGVAFLGLGMAGPLLPVAGVWMIPVGLLLIAEDVPRMHEPVGALHLWLERRWLALRSWALRCVQQA